jgi:acetyl-CoA carboxylase biotin carboxyl carrier protein
LNKPLSTLSDDEVRQITLLVETLEQSTFDFLQLELGDLKVTIGKGSAPPGLNASAAVAVAPPAPAQAPVAVAGPAKSPAQTPAPAAPSQPAPSAAQAGSAAAEDGTVAVVSPMLGRFYAKPEPGAAPFVSVGSEVTADSTVALIEVMKVFTAVRAGVRGIVTEICVQDEQLVEYGHVLIRIRPVEDSAAAKTTRKESRSN